MTQLFQRDKPIKLVELDRAFNASVEKEDELPETIEKVSNVLETQFITSPETPLQLRDIKKDEQPLDLANALSNLTGGSETSATDAIMELGHADDNLPMKSILPNPAAFTTVQVLVDYNRYLGMDNVADFLDGFADWHYKHLCSHKGKRAEQQFGALTQVKQEEFQLEKETKGLFKR